VLRKRSDCTENRGIANSDDDLDVGRSDLWLAATASHRLTKYTQEGSAIGDNAASSRVHAAVRSKRRDTADIFREHSDSALAFSLAADCLNGRLRTEFQFHRPPLIVRNLRAR
jgi:hypothetical protein